jgi:hypothetical protein
MQRAEREKKATEPEEESGGGGGVNVGAIDRQNQSAQEERYYLC